MKKLALVLMVLVLACGVVFAGGKKESVATDTRQLYVLLQTQLVLMINHSMLQLGEES